jgi:hypothetical protein
MRLRALAPLSAIVLLALAGCSDSSAEDQDASPPPSPNTASTSASATPSETPSDPTAPAESMAAESEEPLPEEPSIAETPVQAVPEEPAPEQPAPAATTEPSVEDFLATGGRCISDVWSSSIPRTDELHAQVIDYCSANQLGDWSHGYDPMDPDNYGVHPDAEGESSQSDHFGDVAEEQRQHEIEQCNALELESAMSGDIQYCYMEYGISVD